MGYASSRNTCFLLTTMSKTSWSTFQIEFFRIASFFIQAFRRSVMPDPFPSHILHDVLFFGNSPFMSGFLEGRDVFQKLSQSLTFIKLPPPIFIFKTFWLQASQSFSKHEFNQNFLPVRIFSDLSLGKVFSARLHKIKNCLKIWGGQINRESLLIKLLRSIFVRNISNKYVEGASK